MTSDHPRPIEVAFPLRHAPLASARPRSLWVQDTVRNPPVHWKGALVDQTSTFEAEEV